MGQKIQKFYELAGAHGGLPVQMRLAMKTGIASTQASSVPDSPEVIEKFKAAFKEITGKDAGIT